MSAAWGLQCSRALPSSEFSVMVDIVCLALGVGLLFPSRRSGYLLQSALVSARRCCQLWGARAFPSSLFVVVVNIVEPACGVGLLFPALWQRGWWHFREIGRRVLARGAGGSVFGPEPVPAPAPAPTPALVRALASALTRVPAPSPGPVAAPAVALAAAAAAAAAAPTLVPACTSRAMLSTRADVVFGIGPSIATPTAFHLAVPAR